MNENPIGWLIVAAGIFGILGSVFQWPFFMNSRKAKGLIKLIGVTGSRIFYIVLGFGAVVMGVLIAMGIVQNQN